MPRLSRKKMIWFIRANRAVIASAIILLSTDTISGQGDSPFREFMKLSRPEKVWAILHPFSAREALTISEEVLVTTDSLIEAGIIRDRQGGTADAFKHAYWIALLTREIGARNAWWLGKAHERGNYLEYKKGLRKGKQDLPDRQSSEMDCWNNRIGLNTGIIYAVRSKKEIRRILLVKINMGQMRIIRKNRNMDYLNCSGEIIPGDSLKGKWNTAKCVVPSDQTNGLKP